MGIAKRQNYTYQSKAEAAVGGKPSTTDRLGHAQHDLHIKRAEEFFLERQSGMTEAATSL